MLIAGLAVALDAAERLGDAPVTLDQFGQIVADQFADLGCRGAGVVEIDELRPQRLQPLADAVEQPLRRRRERAALAPRSEEHTSELQSLMRISYAVFCLQKKTTNKSTIDEQHMMQR